VERFDDYPRMGPDYGGDLGAGKWGGRAALFFSRSKKGAISFCGCGGAEKSSATTVAKRHAAVKNSAQKQTSARTTLIEAPKMAAAQTKRGT